MMRKLLLPLVLFSALSVLSVNAEFKLESAKWKSCCIAANHDSVQERDAAEYLKTCLSKMFPQTDFPIVSATEAHSIPKEGTIYD